MRLMVSHRWPSSYLFGFVNHSSSFKSTSRDMVGYLLWIGFSLFTNLFTVMQNVFSPKFNISTIFFNLVITRHDSSEIKHKIQNISYKE